VSSEKNSLAGRQRPPADAQGRGVLGSERGLAEKARGDEVRTIDVPRFAGLTRRQMFDNLPPAHDEANELPALDARLVQWMAVQALQECYARLADGGADIDARIELSSLFIDLPVSAPCGTDRTPEQEPLAMSLLLHGRAPQPEDVVEMSARSSTGRPRWLLVGGPGSGKSTLTTMVAQQLRRPWIERQISALPEQVLEGWQRVRGGLAQLAIQGEWAADTGAFPLRVNLPALARWMAPHGEGSPLSLWDYLAERMVEDLAGKGVSTEVSSGELRALVEKATTICWILDGLDEVPSTAGRSQVIEVVRKTVCHAARTADGVVVSTRPQGYDGEFDDLDALELRPLPAPSALRYGEKLLQAWLANDSSSDLAERCDKMRVEFTKPEVADLIQTPLHTTMAALLVASRGSLPSARSLLYEHYFDTILKRELGKPFDHGIQEVDKGVLQALHARAGITLQVRSQAQTGARSTLRRRELREMLTAIYVELGLREDGLREQVARIMRFAAERLVLLLHASEGEYEFGVRSLQEFFAAQALVEGEPTVVRARLDAIALDPHWSNVLAFVASSSALKTARVDRYHALRFTASLCRAMNAGEVGGEVAARCFMGSRLAIAMLQETERYGHPWLHAPLWEVALEAAASPTQSTFVQVARETTAHRRPGAWTDAVEVHTLLGLLAARWAGADAGLFRQGVIQAAETLLTRSGTERLNGWRLLHGLMVEDLPDAIRVADAYAPTTGEEAREVFQAIASERLSRYLPRWLYAFADQQQAWFSPGRVHFDFKPERNKELLAFKIWRQLCLESAPIITTWEGGEHELSGHVLSIDTNAVIWQDIYEHIPDATPAWSLWKHVAKFMSSPAHSTLADVLEAAVNEEAFSELSSTAHMLPWPMRACVAYARGPEALLALVIEVREGRFGTVEDWRAAEVRWRESPRISLDEVGLWLDADGPWNRDIASRGMALLGWHLGSQPAFNVAAGEIFSWLLKRIESRPAPSRKALAILEQVGFGDLAIPLRVVRLVENDCKDCDPLLLCNIVTLLPDLTGPDADGWFALLDERGRASRNISHPIHRNDPLREECVVRVTSALIHRLREHPDQWGLLNALWTLLYTLPDMDLSGLSLPELPENVPPTAVAMHSLFAVLARCFTVPEIPTLLGQLSIDDGENQVDLRMTLATVLRGRTRDQADALPLLLAALDAQPPPKDKVRDALLGSLFAVHRRSLTAAFATSKAWRAHDFPAPFLAGLSPPRPPSRIVRIAELSNVRLFKETPTVDVPFSQPSGDRGQWLVLVGENGVGKTTLLRALGLTLASPSIASKLLDERLPMVRNGAEGRVAIDLDVGTLAIAVRRGERTEIVESLSPEDAVRPWVVGYGVRRGNARGEKDREAEVGPIGELHTLFDRPASLHNAGQWLRDLDGDVLREQRRTSRSANAPPGPREGVWRSVQHALQVLLKITKIEVDDGGAVYVQHPQSDRVRLDALSDGYLTTAGWVIDMIARWIDRQQELDEPVGADLLRQMCGFVLIDEIDLHLHPMWQMRIIEDVRRLFPRLSFVVTTHNPLTLQGARRGEVYVMRREGARIELIQRDILPGHDVDRVLFEQFGVEHTFDRGTRDLLARHREMLERGVAPGDAERLQIEAQLNERFGSVGEALSGQRNDARGPVAPLGPEERARLTQFLKKKS
jgi:energy-coupling factor transporter ATP-binding protein EcfA2